jgi:hypothetical protein
MANQLPIAARIAAVTSDSQKQLDEFARRYETLQGYKFDREADILWEVQGQHKDFKKLNTEAENLKRALKGVEASKLKLKSQHQELDRVVTRYNKGNVELVGKRLHEFLENKLPALKLLLGDSADVIDGYRALLPQIEQSTADLQGLHGEFRKLEEDLRKHERWLQEKGELEQGLGKIESRQVEEITQGIRELGLGITEAREHYDRWESISKDLSEQLRVLAEKSSNERMEKMELLKKTSHQDLLLSYYQVLVFGSAPKQNIEQVVGLVEGLRTLNLVPGYDLLTIQGLGSGTMNTFEVAASLLFRGVSQMKVGDMYNFRIEDAPFLVGFLVETLRKLEPGPTLMGMGESLVLLRMAGILTSYLHATNYRNALAGLLEKLPLFLCKSKLISALQGWIVRRDDPLESLKTLDTINVGNTRLLIDEGYWLIMLDTSITVAPPGSYQFRVERAVTLDVRDYHAMPWSHVWSIAEIIAYQGAFERILPQPRR